MKRNCIGTIAAICTILGIACMLSPQLRAQEVEFKLSGNTTDQGFSFKNAAGDRLLEIKGNGRITSPTGDNWLVLEPNGENFLDLQTKGTNSIRIYNTNTTVDNTFKHGVLAEIYNEKGAALFGYSNSTTGTAMGVEGLAKGPGTGVYGSCTSTTTGDGVAGITQAQNGRAVYGNAMSATGECYAIYGYTPSPDGWAGFFSGRGYFSKSVGIGTRSPTTRLQVISADDEVISWGNATSTNTLKNDQGGSIELGNSLGSGTSPYIDFHHGVTANEDYNFRIMNSGNHVLQLVPNSAFPPFVTVGQTVLGIGTTAPARTLHVASPTTSCEFIMEVKDGQADWRKWDLCVDGGAGNGQNFTLRVLNDAATAPSRNVMHWMSDGSVGIGTLPNYTLHVNGSAGKPGGGTWTNASDIRLKNVDGDYTRGLSDILRLRPIRFHYKPDNPRRLPSEDAEIGFSAQEVREVFPECVSEGRDGYLDFNMHAINVAMVNAMQELKEQLDTERSRSSALEEGLTALREELKAVKAQLAGRTGTDDGTRADLRPGKAAVNTQP